MALVIEWSEKIMFKQVEKKLIWTYTATTGVILTLVVILALFVSFSNTQNNYKQTFYNNFNVVVSKLQLEDTITNQWIASQEDKNHLIICMEENGVGLKFLRASENQIVRNQQLEKLRSLAKKDEVDSSLPPVSVEEIRSNLYQWEEGSSLYYGQILIFSTSNGYRSLLLLEEFPNAKIERAREKILFLLIDFLGILLLYWVSVWFVGQSLKPIKENKKRQDEFVAAASHELRSPLAVIKANLSLMKKQEKKQEGSIEQIAKECNRMALLIEDMLFLASTDAGNWKIDLKPVEVENLLIETYESYLPLCREKKIVLEVDLQEEEMKNIKGDQERLKQVLCILMENALRFSKEGSTIVLRGRMLNCGKRKVLLEVEDHGSGIPAEKMELIFERFYQEDDSRNDKNHFGLGLSIAKQMVTLQQGTIVCKETKGGGATFTLYFLEID